MSGISYPSLATGSHTFSVEYQDGAGVLSAPAAWTWTIVSALAFTPGGTQGFGAIQVGQTSAPISLTYTFTASETLGSPVALTEGVPNLDFAVTGGTCSAGASFTSGNTCTVNVTFSPEFSGLRRGAIDLVDQSGNNVAMIYVDGIGSGPQVLLLSGYTYSAGSETSLGGGFYYPQGIAVDGAGNTYVADEGNNAVEKVPAGCTSASCVITLLTGLTHPASIAIDGAGNVYVGEVDPSQVLEIPYGCTSNSCSTSLGGGFFGPLGVAVDVSGNVFVADYGNNAVEEMPPGCTNSYCVKSIGSGLIGPEAIAVDANENVFVVQYGLSPDSGASTTGCNLNNLCIGNTVALMEIPAAGGYSTVKTLQSGFNSPIFMALDGNANVYITEWNSAVGEVQEWTAASNYSIKQSLNFTCGSATAGGICSRSGVAVDGSGNIYVGDADSNSILKLNFAAAQSLTFATPTVAGTVDFNDVGEAEFLLNNGNAPLNFSSIAPSAEFIIFSLLSPCATASALPAGGECSVGLLFSPAISGPVAGTLTLTDNNLNVTGATQQVSLSGTGLPPAPIITSGPPNGNTGSTAEFTFSDVDVAVSFYLCSLDNAAFSACQSGVTFSGIGAGVHNLAVEGQDSFGNVSSATTYQWLQIAVTLPDPVITSMPTDPTATLAATFTFTDAEPGVQFNCFVLDENTFTILGGGSCISGVTYATTVGHTYEFAVSAHDSFGNISNSVAYTWYVVASLPPPQLPPAPLPTLASGNFGQEPIAQTTAPLALTLAFNSNGSGTVGSIAALTMGVPNLDFNLVPGGTCTVGMSYTSATTCTVNATFTPSQAGYRRGAIVLQDTAGNGLATAYLQGVGEGPEVIFSPGILKTRAAVTNVNNENPTSVSADGYGNVYAMSTSCCSGSMVEFPAGCNNASCQKTIDFGIGGTSVDGAGNLIVGGTDVNFIAPPGCLTNSCEYEIGANYSTQTQDNFYFLDSNFVDGAGNIYFAPVYDYYGVLEAYASDSYVTPPVKWGGYYSGGTRQIAVDVNGNMFASSFDGGGWEIPAGCAQFSCMISLFPYATYGDAFGVQLDGVGNAYYTTANGPNMVLSEATVASNYSTIITLVNSTPIAESLGMDDHGNLYFADDQTAGNTIQEYDFNTPPTLTFATSTAVGSADTTDGPQTVTLKNNGNGPLTFGSIATTSPSFTIDSGSTTCSTSTQLALQATCTVGVKFAPATSGALTAALVVTDNSLNMPGTAQQLIPLNGTATGPSSLTATGTALQTSSNSVTVGTSVTFTATVTPNTGPVVPTGMVTFMDGGNVLGAGTLNGSGVATFVTSNLAVGSHSVVASYGGDSKSASSTSTAVNVNVAQTTAPTITRLNASPTVVLAGSPLTLTAQVIPASPARLLTGTVTFYDGANLIGTGTLDSSEQATVTNSSLAAGVHTLTAVYGGDTSDTISTSAPLSVTVRPLVNTTTVLQTSANAVVTGSFVTFTATVTPASGSYAATGAVSFFDGTTPLGAVVFNSSGVATLMVNSLALGSHSITASYGGDTYDNASTSPGVSVTVAASVIATTTQLSTSANAVPLGGSVTLTAVVVPTTGTGTPTGSITFLDGSQQLCVVTLDSHAAATCTATFTLLGAHSITASYGGATGVLFSVSPALTINAGPDPTTTTLAASINSIAANNPVTLLANVRPTAGSGTPTGTVTFMDGSTVLGTGTLTARSSVSITTSALGVGLHTITATYGGDSNDLASNSGSALISVTILSTTTELSASASMVSPGANVTFTASVVPSSGTGTPTGTVTFMDGSAMLGNGSLAAGVATFNTSTLALGTHTITAVYSGDGKDAASTSGTVEVTISITTVPTNTALQASTNTPTYGSSVTFTATVAPTSGGGIPSGKVSFMDGLTNLGIGTLNGAGIATYTTNLLSVGSHSVTAGYGGDSKDNASASAPVSVNVSPAPAPAVSLAPGSLIFTAANGGTSASQSAMLTNSGNAALTIGGINVVGANPGSFKQTTTCGSTLAPGANCAISIAFAPTSEAGYLATLSVSDNATGSPHTVALSGQGTVPAGPEASLGPALLAFTANSGTTSASQMATLSNSGNAALTGIVPSITGANPADFAIATGANACGSTLAASSTCIIYVTFTPASAAGFTATLSVADNASGSPQTVTLSGTGLSNPQAINFTQPATPVTYAPGLIVALTANGGASGNAVVFSIDSSSTASGVVSGSTLTVTSAGNLVIDANQAGSANYSAAPQVQRTVVVTQAAQTIGFTQPTTPVTYGGAPVMVSLSATGGASGNSVIFSIDASSTGTGSVSGGTLTITSVGNFVIDANQAGDTNYSAAAQVQRTVVADALTAQAINFTQPTTPVTYSSGLTISLVATGGGSENPVVFTLDASSTGVGSISGSTLTVTAAGSFTIDANQAGNANYAAAPQVQRTVVVTQAPQVINFTQPTTPVTYGGTSVAVPLSATGGASGNPVVFAIDSSSTASGAISGSTLTVTSVGTLTIDANQAGNTNYTAAAQVQRGVTVNAVPPDFSITVTPPSQSVAPGVATTYTVTVTPTGAFNSNVALSLTGQPTGTMVTFAPSSLTPAGSAVASTLTITPPALAQMSKPGFWPLSVPTLALLLLLPFKRWRRAWKGKLLLLVAGLASLAALGTLNGCGGGFGLLQSQTYTLTVTGTAGSTTHSFNMQLTVKQ